MKARVISFLPHSKWLNQQLVWLNIVVLLLYYSGSLASGENPKESENRIVISQLSSEPHIKYYSKLLMIKRYDNITLKCDVYDSSSINVRWLRNDKPIEHLLSFNELRNVRKRYFIDSVGKLQINFVRNSDLGVWRCLVRKSGGNTVLGPTIHIKLIDGIDRTETANRHPRDVDNSADHTETNMSNERLSPKDMNRNHKVDLLVNQHKRVTLKCEVNINFTNNIWLKDGEVVESILVDVTNSRGVGGHRYTRDRLGHLFIDNVRREDNGRWQCEAEDAFGFVMTAKPIHLTVIEPPKKPYFLIDNRRLDPGNLFVPVKESAELDIQCFSDGGNPRPKLTWDLSIAPTPSSTMEGPDVTMQALNLTVVDKELVEVGTERPGGDNAGVMSEAKLRVLRAHHNATISCLLHHITLTTPLQASLLLDVQYTPSFAISREPGFGIPVLEGMPVSLKCDVDANPNAAPVWQKDDGPPPVAQSLDGFLNFTTIRREHSGWYKCTSRYLSGQFSSIGYFLNVRYEAVDVTQEPEFDVGELSATGRQVEVALGGAVQLQCPAGTHGCWTRMNSDSGRLSPLGASQDLRLDKILYQEAGEYRCVAPGKEYKEKMEVLKNALIVNISVKGRPMVHPPYQNVTAIAGQQFSVSLEFCANPQHKNVLWFSENEMFRPLRTGSKENRIVAHEITNTTIQNCYQAKLTFSPVEIRDRGEYTFLVRSPMGVADGSIFLNIVSNKHYDSNNESSNGPKIYEMYANFYLFVNIIIICWLM